MFNDVNVAPTISVIVPIYNSEKYLSRCIDSILSQTFDDFELLLVNDGSTDNSGLICDEYALKDFRVRVFHKGNGGVASARNLGLDKAKGKWVTFCDSDDWVYSNWLQIFMNNIRNVDVVCQGFELDYSLTKKSNRQNLIVGFNYIGEVSEGIELLHSYGLLGSMCVKLFKMDIINEFGLRLDLRFNYSEDEEFVVRYLSKCVNVRSVAISGYYYYYLCSEHLNKYVIKNGFELFQSLFINATTILNNKSCLSLYYLDKYTLCLIEEFDKSIELNKLRVYKRTVGRAILLTNMFWLTKWCIYLDTTLLFGSLILKVHNKCKNLAVI